MHQWSVEFKAESGGDGNKKNAWTEERLFDLAALSGAMGSELVEEGSGLVLRAAYRSSREIGALLAELRELLADFPGIALRAHGKVEDRPWHTQHLEAFPPLEAGRELVVMAPWHRDSAPEGRILKGNPSGSLARTTSPFRGGKKRSAFFRPPWKGGCPEGAGTDGP